MGNSNYVTPRCPVCGHPLIEEHCIATEQLEHDTFIQTNLGKCSFCNRHFLWDDHYQYSYSNNVTNVEDLNGN